MIDTKKRHLVRLAALAAVAGTTALVGCGKKEEPAAAAPAATPTATDTQHSAKHANAI